jgi:hypothetical protein
MVLGVAIPTTRIGGTTSGTTITQPIGLHHCCSWGSPERSLALRPASQAHHRRSLYMCRRLLPMCNPLRFTWRPRLPCRHPPLSQPTRGTFADRLGSITLTRQAAQKPGNWCPPHPSSNRLAPALLCLCRAGRPLNAMFQWGITSAFELTTT